MLLFSCRGIKKSYGDHEVLKGIDLDINEGERTGIVGINGAGKTTLADIIFGSLKPDEGYIKWGNQAGGKGYLLQSSICVFSGAGDDCCREKEDAAGYANLSGGERTRLSLKKLLSVKPRLLILDEPTNHLDFAGAEWLAGRLKDYGGTVVVISHDRYFMDLVVGRIVEIDNGFAKSYSGNYTSYRGQKKKEYEDRLHLYMEQEKRKDRLEEEIERVRMWAAKSHREAGKKGKMAGGGIGAKEYYRIAALKMDRRAKSKMKRLERMEEQGIEKPAEEAALKFAFSDAVKHGKRILEARELGKGYEGRLLFQGASFYMLHGDRVGVVGPNGCGKTTLLKIINGEESPDSGEIWISRSANAAYISQDVGDLDISKSPAELVEDAQSLNSWKVRRVFASLGIDEKMLRQQIGSLSQGERMRVKLALAILEGGGFLILDEPTNHLDLFSRERLEDALDEYAGTILIVSHDRYLLERICSKLLVFEKGRIIPFGGRFGEYLSSRPLRQENGAGAASAEEKLLLENRIAAVLGRLSSISSDNPLYPGLEEEFLELSRKKMALDAGRK